MNFAISPRILSVQTVRSGLRQLRVLRVCNGDFNPVRHKSVGERVSRARNYVLSGIGNGVILDPEALIVFLPRSKAILIDLWNFGLRRTKLLREIVPHLLPIVIRHLDDDADQLGTFKQESLAFQL